jgi:hypothetical protein
LIPGGVAVELLLEIIVQIFGEICCQMLLAGAADLVAGVAGYRAFQARGNDLNSNEPARRRWWFFGIMLALGTVLTVVVLASVARRWAH